MVALSCAIKRSEKLMNLQTFDIAQKGQNEDIDALERPSDRDHEQLRMLRDLKQALTDLREGIPAIQRMLQAAAPAQRIAASSQPVGEPGRIVTS